MYDCNAHKKITGADCDAFNELIERYADGMKICNCREAYYHPIGRGSRCIKGEWTEHSDMDACYGGCSTNKIRTKYYIAKRVAYDLKMLWEQLKKDRD